MIQAVNAQTGQTLGPTFAPTSPEQLREVVEQADRAFEAYRHLSGSLRGHFLRTIASELEALRTEITERAHLETALPMARLNAELTRTTSQLLLFAELAEEGSWVDARIDPALPDRVPRRPDLRSLLTPLGVVAVFGASNFPLAFSVAGGDTASALAAGCTVVVKAHNGHPGTSQLAAQAIESARQKCGLPEGVFGLVFGTDHHIGELLVTDPRVKAVGFTGSRRGGLALTRLAQQRPEPIPVFAEMSSINPVVVFPDCMQQQAEALAEGLFASFTLGAGQFCTNPGLVLVPRGSHTFKARLQALVSATTPFAMLNPEIQRNHLHSLQQLKGQPEVQVLAAGSQPGAAVVLEVHADDLTPDVQQEVFGPCTVLFEYRDLQHLQQVLPALEGQLTATLHVTDADLPAAVPVLSLLEQKVGRVVFNGFPTGVEVSHSMVHGGPFPATTDARTTSVGSRAIERFCRLTCYQDCPDELLPPALQEANPLHLLRLREGKPE